MRTLIAGNGKSGSWKIRGEQLGGAIGADVMPAAEMAEIRNAGLVVCVKKTPPAIIAKIRAAGKPWVWDVVDAWPQPFGNEWPRDTCVRWLKDSLALLQPTAVVFPTSQMWADSGWTGPALVLPHHAWPKYRPQAVQEAIQVVAYEGEGHYLGKWAGVIHRECRRRGWEFRTGTLAGADIGIALRDVSGYACGAWKANTKLANCQALGIPAICSPESSYVEFGSGTEILARSEDEIRQAFNLLTPYDVRVAISEAMQRHAPRLETVAREYRTWLDSLKPC